MTAREKFKIGDRVQLTDAYVASLRNKGWASCRLGHIVGFCTTPDRVQMVRDGFRKGTHWHISMLEKTNTPLSRPATTKRAALLALKRAAVRFAIAPPDDNGDIDVLDERLRDACRAFAMSLSRVDRERLGR